MAENIEEIFIKQEISIEVTEVICPIYQVKEEVEIEEHDILLDPQLRAMFPDVNDLEKKLFTIDKEAPQTTSPNKKDSMGNDSQKQLKDLGILNERWFSSKVVLEDCGEMLRSSGNLCQECRVLFPNHNALNKHRCISTKAKKIVTKKAEKEKLKRFKCDLCSYMCESNCSLILHHRTHTKEKPFKCNLCNYESAQKSHLIRHMVTHTNERRYCCNLCDYKGADSTSLKKHTRIHTKYKPFKCNLCDYRATQSPRLKEHMKTHFKHENQVKEKLFKCDICEYRCGHKSYLKIHHRNVHTNERPFECDFCKYRCSQSSTLTRHMRRHTQEKPFKCDLCEYRGARSCSVKYHMKSHHRRP